jgi:hypothetical protein
MLKRLYKTFYYETFFYVLDSPKEIIIEKIDHLFVEKSGLFKSPNLRGKYVDYPNTFYLTQKWWFGHIKGLEGEPAILKGVITAVNSTQTKIEVSVRPNSVFWVLAILFLPYGLYTLYKGIRTNELNTTLGGLWLIFFGAPILYFFAQMTSKKLRTSFEKYMNMQPIDEDRLFTSYPSKI